MKNGETEKSHNEEGEMLMKHFAKILALLLTLAMILSMLPTIAFAAESKDDVWALINDYEASHLKRGPKEASADDYAAMAGNIANLVMSSNDYKEGTCTYDAESGNSFFFWESADGEPNGYSPRLRAQIHKNATGADPEDYAATETKSFAVKGGNPSSTNVAVFQPYYGIDSSFTTQYKLEGESIAAATGGTCTTYLTTNATISQIGAALSNCGVVIFDSHGDTDYYVSGSDDYVTQANTSYLCLQTSSGWTSADKASATGTYGTYYHAYNAGSNGNMYYYCFDGTAMANHMSGSCNNLVWMAICLGMATTGLHAPLRNAGVEVVYGYSQSTSFDGDYEYEEDFWNKMKAGETVATAFAYMTRTYKWDPAYASDSSYNTIGKARYNYVAFPNIVSDEDTYQGHRTTNPSSATAANSTTYNSAYGACNIQTVNSTWTLLGEPEPATVTLMAGSSQYGSTISTTTNTATTLPSYSGTVPTGYTFAGWTDSAISGTTNSRPTLYNGTFTPSATTTTLYACFSKADANGGSGNYEKVVSTRANSDFEDGTYLIVCESNNVAFNGGLDTLDAVSNTISVTISNNTIESNSTTDAATFTYSSSDGSFLSASGKYIGRSANTNGLDSSTSALSNTVSLNGTNVDIVGAGGAYLRYNQTSGQYRFRYFKSSSYSSQQPIQLYKLAAGGNTYTTTISSCSHNYQVSSTVAATCTVTGAIEYTCSICGDSYIEETPALGHNMVAGTVHAATCTEEGYTEYACSRCNATDIGDIVAATGHVDANSDDTCDVCGADLSTPAVTSGWYLVDDYTNLEDGIYALITPNNYAFNGTISSGHGQKTDDAFSWDANGYSATAPSGTLELTFTSTANGFTLYNATLGYLYASKASSGGLAFHASEDSGWSFSADGGLYAANSAHLRSYNDTFRTYAGNSNATIGLAHKVESAVQHEHTPENVAAVAATCTTAGTTAGTVCSVCGAVISGCEEVAALGHDWVAGTPVAATCTEAGYTPYTCSRCAETKQEPIAATGHVDANSDNVCDVCGADLSTPAGDDFSGDYYIAAIRTTGNYQWMTNDLGTASTKRYQAEDSGLDTLPAAITENVDAAKTWTLAKQQDGTYLLSSGGSYSTWTSGNSADLGETGIAITVTANGDAVQMTISDGARYLSLNSTAANNYFAYYGGTQINDLYLVPVNGTIAPPCEHTNTTTTGAVAATCTTDGYTGDVVCSDCGATITAGSVIPATGHTDANSDDVCDVCGADLSTPAVTSGWYLVTDYTNLEDGVYAIISPNNYAFNGTISSGHGQKTDDAFSWDANGYSATAPTGTLELTFTSTANGFTIYDATLGYLYASKASSGGLAFHASEDSGWSFSADGGLYAANSAHLRSYNDTFRTYAGNSNATIGLAHKVESAVQHEHTPENVAAVAATCTTAGTTAGTVCSVCGAVISGCEEVAALGHDWVAGTPVAATCTEAGYTPYTCSRCAETKQEPIAATGHVDANSDNVCDVCGADLSTPAGDDFSGDYYIAAIRTTGNYQWMTSDLGTASTKRYQAEDSGLDTLPAAITENVDAAKTWTLAKQQDGTYLLSSGGSYSTWSSGNSANLGSTGVAITITESGDAVNMTIPDGESTRNLSLNSTSSNNYFAYYGGTQINDLYLVPVTGEVPTPATHTAASFAGQAATCTEPGVMAYYYCEECLNDVSGEHYGKAYSDAALTTEIADTVIPALGHTLTATAAVAATCTTAGNSAYWTCSVCGKYFSDAAGTTEIQANSWVIAATGHTLGNYIDNGNGTHDEVCPVCGTVLTDDEAHVFDNGVCIGCGATETPVEHIDNNLTFATINLQLEAYIGADFFFLKTKVAEYDSYFVRFTYPTADGSVTEDVQVEAYSKYYYGEHQVAAKEMADTIQATIYATKDGVTYHGPTTEWTLMNAMRTNMDKSTATAAAKGLYVAILNYGEKAQQHFNYNTELLATSVLTAAEISTYLPAARNAVSVDATTSNGLTGVTFYKMALSCGPCTVLNVMFKPGTGVNISDVECHISYTNRAGVETEDVIDEFTPSGTRYVALFQGMTAKQLGSTMQITFYSKTTGQPISETRTYSEESYIADNPATGTKAALFTALVQYADAAAAHFGS